ncbi:pre-peptidase C-terminal domain-containing protein [Herpetosiphon llansteffanensis]
MHNKRWSLFLLIIFSLMALPVAQAEEASPQSEEASPQAIAVAWERTAVQTTEGVSVWLKVMVYGAGETESISLNLRYQTFNGTAIAGSDYSPTAGTGNALTITGLRRYALINIGILANAVAEPYEQFQVELRSETANVSVIGGARTTIGISRSRVFAPVVGDLQACIHVGEPANNASTTAGVISLSGGWCESDFIGEVPSNFDYYQFKVAVGGKVTIQLDNITPDQHDFNLYLYYRDGNGQFQVYEQSGNTGQTSELLSNVPIAAQTTYLINIVWAAKLGDKTPVYRVKALYQP